MEFRCVFSLAFLCITVAVAHDPCERPHYLYDTGDRNPNCSVCKDDASASDCTLKDGWYKVVNMMGPLNMTSHRVREGSCGAPNPIWLNGSHPEREEGVVNRTACVAFGRSSCYSKINIQVKNCSNYFVYYLRRTRVNQRYCFDSNSNCSAVGNGTDHSTERYPVYLTFYSKFGCMMFFGGFLIGSLLVLIIVTVRSRRSNRPTTRTNRPSPAPGRASSLPPPYAECVAPGEMNKY